MNAADTAPAEEPPAGGADSADAAALLASEVAYLAWGWPVTRHLDQMWLSLHSTVSGLAIPVTLCADVTQNLTQRRCAPPVLAHPDTPAHHIVLIGERYGVPLPWPGHVQRLCGAVLLPPTVTARGAVSWVQAPQADSLRLCREIDVFAALRTALSHFPATRQRPSPR